MARLFDPGDVIWRGCLIREVPFGAVVGAQKGVPTMQKGVPAMRKGVPSMQKGVPAMQKGVPTIQLGKVNYTSKEGQVSARGHVGRAHFMLRCSGDLKLGPEWLRFLWLSAAAEKLGVEFDRSGLHGGLAIFEILKNIIQRSYWRPGELLFGSRLRIFLRCAFLLQTVIGQLWRARMGVIRAVA